MPFFNFKKFVVDICHWILYSLLLLVYDRLEPIVVSVHTPTGKTPTAAVSRSDLAVQLAGT